MSREDNYKITENGDVYGINGFKLKPAINRQGYYTVILYINKKPYCKRISRLVAEKYIPNPLNLPEINHKDGNKLNNCVDNLEWCTRSQNQLHAIRNGLQKIKYGEYTNSVKLTEVQVKEIRELKNEMKQCDIAKIYNVDASLISLIVNNKLWKHVS